MTRNPAWIFGALLVGYGALLLSQIDHGLASLDAHGIIRVVVTLIDHHKIDVSRPPGHPTTEFYLFGAVGWVLHLVGHRFDEHAYLLGQAIAAIATLVLFYRLLRALAIPAMRACIAILALGLSAQFLANAIDGEEFVFALFFILLALRLLISDQPIASARLSMSIFVFALATGCRPEAIFAIVIYPIYFRSARLAFSRGAFAAGVFVIAMLLVWLPIFFVGLRAPYDAGMNLKQALLAGAYKLLFQCFGVATFVALMVVPAREISRRPWRETFPRNFVGQLACVIPLLFFALFFRYATKPAYVLVALPFLLIVACESRALIFTIAILTAAEFFVKIDIFQDRQLQKPFLAPGNGLAAIRQKPFYRLRYLRGVLGQCGNEPTLVVADAAPWDFAYHIEQRNIDLTESSPETATEAAVYASSSGRPCSVMSRDAAFEPALLQKWRTAGYTIKMDATLHRVASGRYDIHPNESTEFELFSVKD